MIMMAWSTLCWQNWEKTVVLFTAINPAGEHPDTGDGKTIIEAIQASKHD